MNYFSICAIFALHVSSLRLASPIDKDASMYMWDLDEEDTPLTHTKTEKLGHELSMDPDYYFGHNQKAGGTTIRSWLKKVCAELKAEGKTESEDCVVTHEAVSITKEEVNTLFGAESTFKAAIINLREPVARVQSLFNNWIFVDEKRGLDPHSLEWYIHSDTSICKNALHKTEPTMSHCFENMYVKSLVGTNPRNSDSNWQETTMDDLDVAKERLEKFSALVITEWLDRPEMADYICKHVFHLNRTIPFGHDRNGKAKMPQSHQQYHNFTPQQWAQMAERNKFDSMLYHYAKELAFKRMRDAGFSMPETLLKNSQ